MFSEVIELLLCVYSLYLTNKIFAWGIMLAFYPSRNKRKGIG